MKINLLTAEEKIDRWVKAWQTASPILAELRHRQIKEASTQQAVLHLGGGVDEQPWLIRRRSSSGLIEQQRFFQKVRE